MVKQLINTRIFSGIIRGYRKESNEIFIYRINFENHHQPLEFIDGVPIFNFEYNGLVYPLGSRVLCLIRDNDFSQTYVLGQIYDPNINRNAVPANAGEVQLNSSLDAKSGLGPLGKNDNFVAFGGSSHLKMNSTSFKIDVDNTKVLIEGSIGELKLIADVNNSQGIVIKDTFMNIIANGGFKVSSVKGDILLIGDSFKFFNSDSEKPFFYFSKGALKFTGIEYLSNFGSYNITAGNGLIKGRTTTVDWNVISGSYAIRLGTGDFKINLMNSLAAEVYFKIGIGPLYLSQFSFTQSTLDIKIGAALPDTLKLGEGEIAIKVGNFPGLQSEFIINGSKGSLKINGLLGSSSYEYKSLGITFENSSTISGSATLEIADGKLTLTSASKALGGKIILDGEVEVTGKLTVKGSDGIEATSGDVKAGTISLKQHKHASSIPGGPSTPLAG